MQSVTRLSNGSRYTYLYPLRNSELPIIKKNRSQFLRSILGDEKTDKHFELTKKEFLMMASLYQMNMNYFSLFLDLVTTYGGIFVCFVYVILQLTIGMPLFMLYSFMSYYSKKSYLKFWECMPIFGGMGYTIAIIRFCTEVYNALASGLCLLLISDMFREDHQRKIKTCDSDVGNTCVPMYPTENKTTVCSIQIAFRPLNETVFIATQFYVRNDIMLYNRVNANVCCTFNIKLIIACACIWFLIFCFSIFGIDKIRKVTINAQLVLSAIMFLVSLYSVLFSTGVIGKLKLHHDARLDTFNFWVDMITHAAEANVLGNMIYLGTLKPSTLTSRHAALIVSPIKLIVFVGMTCYCSRIKHQILKHYRIKDARCLISYGHDIIFAFVPDVLYRMEFGFFMVLMWYLCILYFSILPPIYSLIALVDSITEKFVKMNRYRLFVYLVASGMGLLLNCALCTNIGFPLIYTYRTYGIPLLTTSVLLLISLGLMFVYSIKRIVDDYSFMFGVPPHKYWIVFWKTTPLFALFAFIFNLVQIKTSASTLQVFTTYRMIQFSYIQCSTMLLPVVIMFLAKCLQHVKFRTLGSMSKPSEKWGPFNPVKKQSRKFFYPQRDVKYRNNVLNCKHNCMANNDKFHQENRNQAEKLHVLLEKIKTNKKSNYLDVTADILY